MAGNGGCQVCEKSQHLSPERSEEQDPWLRTGSFANAQMTILRQVNLAVVTILRIAEQLQLLNHKLSISESNSE